MSTPLISDMLWEIVAPLLPPEPPKPKGGRPRSISDRAALTGIIFVLKSGIPWEMLPQELGLRQRDDVLATPERLAASGRVEALAPCSPATAPGCGADRLGAGVSSTARACRLLGGEATGKDPTNRGKLGTKRHLRGGPRAECPFGDHLWGQSSTTRRRWSSRLMRFRRCGSGQAPRAAAQAPHKLHADKGYDYPRCRRALRSRGIIPRIARRGIESRRAARALSLGGGAHPFLAQSLPPSQGAL